MSISTRLAPPEKWGGRLYRGDWQAGAGGTQSIIEKATGETLGEIGIAAPSDVAQAAEAAAQAQVSWASLPAPARGDILRKFAAVFLDNVDELAEWLIRETGSSRLKGRWEAQMASRVVMEGAMLASQPIGLMLPTAEPGRHSYARRVPVGVVGVITPWNSPLTLGCRAIAPALAMGNAVLLKPDPQTPVSGGVMLAALAEAAGLPKNLLHILPGGVETGEAIVTNPRVAMVSFTGSTRAGRRVGALAGEQGKRVSLEMGGNNAYVVLEDADASAAAAAAAWGAFFHQGQICTTIGRHIVHESIAESYARELTAKALKLRMGDPFRSDVELGPLINERQARNVERIVRETVAAGAKLALGGTRDGLYFTPTILTDVRPGMPAFDEEIFGPVAPIITFGNDEEAVALANASHYGLVSSVVSPDLTRASRIAERLHAGMVHVNDQTVVHEVYGPVGGVGASGNGWNYGTTVNADQFSEWQWHTVRAALPKYPF
ncbi:MAG: aldehyde dehydrogenase family protein [Burkholderiales bacterium]|nr:aldehyde dehydrogenase family protein [Burkholderiales bacterium]